MFTSRQQTRRRFTLASVATLLLTIGSVQDPLPRDRRRVEPAPDLILTGGKVFTADSAAPWAEALAVRGHRIMAVGTTSQIAALAGPHTRRIDVGGRVVIPGINDAHVHLGEATLGARFETSDRTPAGPSMAEVLDSLRVMVQRTPAGAWIQGPLGTRILMDTASRRAVLDVVAPRHPVILRAPWGHGIVVNSAGLRALGIADTARDPLGGAYERDAAGRLTGSLVEYAGWAAVQRAQRQLSDTSALRQLRAEVRERLAFGVTSLQNMSSTWDAATTARLFRAAQLPVRVRLVRFPMPNAAGRDVQAWTRMPTELTPLVRVSGVKYVLEGTPIEQGALNRTAYTGRPAWHGQLNFPLDTLRAFLRDALTGAHGTDQLLLHVVGDSTAQLVLTMMTELAPDSVWRNKRLRIEHASRLTGPLIDRARAMGIQIAQPRNSAAYRSWLHAGLTVGYGSDGQPNPFLDLVGAVTTPSRPGEAITREEAVRLLTHGSAMVEGLAAQKGTISVGKLADVAVLSQDIFTVAADRLSDTRSVLTVIGGTIVYSHGEVSPPH